MKLKLKVIPPAQPDPVYKASLHKTGKIGLAIDTSKKFGLTTDKAITLLINEEDENDKNIYGIVGNVGEPNSYKIMKAGDYHSINSKSFFDTLKMDYENYITTYTVTEIMVDGQGGVLKFEPVKNTEKVIPANTGLK